MLTYAVCLAFLIPASVACLYYLIPTLAGLCPRRAPLPTRPQHMFVILIPAHNEERELPRTLQSLAHLDYPSSQLRICVVADNCTDHTARVAEAGGATCWVRTDCQRRGKGYAVAFGLEQLATAPHDAVLILDADCVLNVTALRELDAVLASGADAAQAGVYSRNADAGPAGYVAAVGSAIDHATAQGRDRLGLSVPLRGTGMAFRQELLTRVPWQAFTAVEDAEYAGQLRAAGVRVHFCGAALVSCEAPTAVESLCRQRRRWRAAARFLNSKPLVLFHLLCTLAVCGACGLVIWPAVLVLLTAGVYLRAVAVVGWKRNRLGLLFRSAGVVARLGWLTVTGFGRRPSEEWDRTPRSEGLPA